MARAYWNRWATAQWVCSMAPPNSSAIQRDITSPAIAMATAWGQEELAGAVVGPPGRSIAKVLEAPCELVAKLGHTIARERSSPRTR